MKVRADIPQHLQGGRIRAGGKKGKKKKSWEETAMQKMCFVCFLELDLENVLIVLQFLWKSYTNTSQFV